MKPKYTRSKTPQRDRWVDSAGALVITVVWVCVLIKAWSGGPGGKVLVIATGIVVVAAVLMVLDARRQ